MAKSLLALLCAALGLFGVAHAQATVVNSTPVVVHGALESPPEGVVERRMHIVARQRATTNRAVVIDAPIARPSSAGRQNDGFPAGERLFGVYDGFDSWAYCALRQSMWGDSLVCYADADADGRFETAKPSGAPFLGIPFFIWTQREARALANPVAYRALPYGEGPAIQAGLRVDLQESRTRRGQTTPASAGLDFGFIVDDRFVPVSGASSRMDLSGAGPWTLRSHGAEVELSGAPTRNQLRYRIVTPMPAQIQRVEMSRTVTTTTTYVPIFIPN